MLRIHIDAIIETTQCGHAHTILAHQGLHLKLILHLRRILARQVKHVRPVDCVRGLALRERLGCLLLRGGSRILGNIPRSVSVDKRLQASLRVFGIHHRLTRII